MLVSVLGPVRVQSAAGPLRLGGTKQRAVLVMLALRADQVVSQGFLVDGLLGATPPAGAANTVQTYVSRKILHSADPADPPVDVLHRRPGYLLQIEPEMIDLHRFERMVRDGVAALPAAPTRSADLLREALGLWRGRAVGRVHRRTLRPGRDPPVTGTALGRGGRAGRRRSGAGSARHADRGTRRTGRRAPVARRAARATNAQPVPVRAASRSAGGVPAGPWCVRRWTGHRTRPRLHDLQNAILGHDPQLDWTPTPTVGSTCNALAPNGSGDGRVWNVPARNPHLTSRGALLDRLHDRLLSGDNTLVVQALYGLGGVGKTQLAIEYAHRHATEYDLVWWINAEQPALIPEQLTALAEQFGTPNPRATAGTVAWLLAELTRRTKWLLIFDNAEHPTTSPAIDRPDPGRCW